MLTIAIGLADGLCVIEIGLPAFGVSDESTGFEVAHAAWMIINTCVADLRHEGGRMDGAGMLFSPSIHTSQLLSSVYHFPPPLP